jgi:threonine dehydrogenase-like Zn-dependent dehydrogenase
VLGIHDLPGGFGPWVLAPERAAIPLPDSIASDVAVLVEPFAAALHAAESIAPGPGERVAVLGPRRLGLLVVAALAARRKRDDSHFQILALSRHPALGELALKFGADEAADPGRGGSEAGPSVDIVIDTTGSPAGLEKAIALARQEVHLKSTHGQAAAGLAHITELVVDEIGLQAWPDDEGEMKSLLAQSTCRPGDRPRVAWLASAPPPSSGAGEAEWVVGSEAATLLDFFQGSAEGRLPRADLAVVEDEENLDAVVRPRAGEEIALVRPRGRICILGEGGRRGPLLQAIGRRGLRLSTSRCGDFKQTLELLEADAELRERLSALVTHRLPAGDLARALELARSPGCIKVVLHHGPDETSPRD